MKANELRKKSIVELKKEYHGLLKEQFNRRMVQATKPHLIKQVRHNIARVKTVITQLSKKVEKVG
jgi:large subunit ribosomal protein L29